MKRNLSILAVLLICMTAAAQINVKASGHNYTICKDSRFSSVEYSTHTNSYFLSIRSTNQFDSPFIIELGPDKQAAISSLNALIAIDESGTKDMVTIESYGDTFHVRRQLGALSFSGGSHAGTGDIMPSLLKRGVKKIQDYVEPSN